MKTWPTVLLLCTISLAQGAQYSRTDHFDGDRFFNPQGPPLKSFWSFLKWRWEGSGVEWPVHVPNNNYQLPKLETGKGFLTFINHATFLIQLPGLTILTDPIFSERAGPFQNFGPAKRVREPGVDLEELPSIDVVLISHNHFDHLDLESLKRIDGKYHPLFLVPLGDEKLLKEAGIQNVHEMDWWNVKQIKAAKITFTPVQHWSARGLFDKNKSLWGGYFIDLPPLKIYFAGDTGYTPWFLQTKNRLGAPDMALLPIGAYDPRWFMKDSHMNPEEAVQAHIDLGAGISFGMHFGTFKLTNESIDQPLKDLEAAKEKMKIGTEKFKVLDFGESWVL